jgi:D-alanyl-D-alanine carboxypeptidase
MSNSCKGTDIIDANTHAQGYLNGIPNSTYPMTIPFGAGDFSSTPNDMELWINAVKTSWFSEAEQSRNIYSRRTKWLY